VTDELDPVLRARLDRLARAVPVAPERLRPIATASPRYRGLSGLGVLAAAVLILVLALAAASMGGAPAPSPTGNVAAMTDGTFEMSIQAPKTHYAIDEPIEVLATLEYLGPEPSIDVSSAPGMPGFGVEQLDGSHRADPGYRLSCASRSFDRGQPVAYPFSKSGGFSPEMPDADFMSRYLNIVDGRADPVLRLPAGTWRVFAEAQFAEGGCSGTAHKLEVGITIVVAGALASSPPPAPVVQLPTATQAAASGACPQAGMSGVTLRGDPTNTSRPVWVETWTGQPRTILWPYGFSARFNPALELLNEQGDVVAREGDVLQLTGGQVDPAFDFYACRVRVVSAPPAQGWGPLAVLPRQDGMDMARNEGTLRITDSCVYLEWAGERTLLVWHEGQPTWNEASRSITFENFDGIVVTLRDGDRIEVGGSGGGSDESGETGEEFVRRMTWVAPPAPSCSVDPWFGVGGVAQLAWGPLAVAREDAQNDLDAGTGPGRLVVGSRCVTLLQDAGAELTLIWRSAQTGWDPDAREILFDDRNLGVIRLSDGARLSLGGAGLADPASPDQGAPQPEWMAPPDPSCPDGRWVVHQVYLLDQ
jgi:hypothetical protein